MTEIKQISPLTRIKSIPKDRNKSSRQESAEDKNDKNKENRDSRDQPGGSSHVNEYV